LRRLRNAHRFRSPSVGHHGQRPVVFLRLGRCFNAAAATNLDVDFLIIVTADDVIDSAAVLV
jgi:hypothetical protein